MSTLDQIVENLNKACYKRFREDVGMIYVDNVEPSTLKHIIERIPGMVVSIHPSHEANGSIITWTTDEGSGYAGKILVFESLPARLLIQPLSLNIWLNKQIEKLISKLGLNVNEIEKVYNPDQQLVISSPDIGPVWLADYLSVNYYTDDLRVENLDGKAVLVPIEIVRKGEDLGLNQILNKYSSDEPPLIIAPAHRGTYQDVTRSIPTTTDMKPLPIKITIPSKYSKVSRFRLTSDTSGIYIPKRFAPPSFVDQSLMSNSKSMEFSFDNPSSSQPRERFL